MKLQLFSLLLLITSYVGAQPQRLITTREEAVELIAELRKIHTPEGIETLEQVELNGEKQWITIRGRNVDNPILLFIHGGPSSPIMPISWTFQNSWEDYFTVVQWDQRVTGKNWTTADTTKAIPNYTMKTIINDGVALIEHLRKRFNKDKIFLLGLSWGTMLGTHIAAQIPNQLYAYIGVGQAYQGDDEKYLYDRLFYLATKNKNETALAELKSIAPYPNPNGNTPVESTIITRKWARMYDGGWYGKRDFKLYFTLPQLSPDYNKADLDLFYTSIPWGLRKLLKDLQADVRPMEFKLPVFFIMGRYDLHTPYETAKIYFDKLKAPKKKFITFERSSHFPMIEEPGRFLVTLVNEILPLAGRSSNYKIEP